MTEQNADYEQRMADMQDLIVRLACGDLPPSHDGERAAYMANLPPREARELRLAMDDDEMFGAHIDGSGNP